MNRGRHDFVFTSSLRKLEEQPPGEDAGGSSRHAIRRELNKWATATTTYGPPMHAIMLPSSDGVQKNNVAVEVVESGGVPLPKLHYITQRANKTQHTTHNKTQHTTQHNTQSTDTQCKSQLQTQTNGQSQPQANNNNNNSNKNRNARKKQKPRN